MLLTGIQTMCIALAHFGGAIFHRISSLCGNVSYGTAWNATDRVRDALCAVAPRYIRLPTFAEMEETARRMEEKFYLPGFALGLDGMFVRFDGAVKDIPIGNGLPVLQVKLDGAIVLTPPPPC